MDVCIGNCRRRPHAGSEQFDLRRGTRCAPACVNDVHSAGSYTRTSRLELNCQRAVRVCGDVPAVVPNEDEVGRVSDGGNRGACDDLGC